MFAETSSNVKDFVETTVEYGFEHLGASMSAITSDVAKMALTRRYKAQLSVAVWRGYSNLILDNAKYVGTGVTCTGRA